MKLQRKTKPVSNISNDGNSNSKSDERGCIRHYSRFPNPSSRIENMKSFLFNSDNFNPNSFNHKSRPSLLNLPNIPNINPYSDSYDNLLINDLISTMNDSVIGENRSFSNNGYFNPIHLEEIYLTY